MTRFREEIYASSWYKALVKAKVQGSNHTVSAKKPVESPDPRQQEWRALRQEYFAKKSKEARNPRPKELLDG